jgi:nitrous oxide reductase accessory protein NosL
MFFHRKLLFIALFLTIILTCGALHADNTIPPPTAKDKCPVCGMFVSSYKEWLAALRLHNGSIKYFDGPKDLSTFYLNPGRYAPSAKQADITAVIVTDYYSLRKIDGRTAYFVIGSDVLGPMGKELIPFAKKSDAQAFLTDHKGKKIIGFKEITPAVLKSLE